MLRSAITLLVLFSALTGAAYPALVTGLAQAIFPRQANGEANLVGQPFDDPSYFWGRPSAVAYDGRASGGSNLGPLNPALHEAISGRVAKLKAAEPLQTGPVPVDLVTTSASGLDPHISPAAAHYQAGRVARGRGLDPATVKKLVDDHVEGRLLGIVGEPVVNVLRLNLALDKLSGR